MWDLPRPGLKPVSPALASGFITTAPPQMSPLTTFIQNSFGSLSHGNQKRERNKRNPNWKEEVKMSLFSDDMIIYVENPKGATKKLLKLFNEW